MSSRLSCICPIAVFLACLLSGCGGVDDQGWKIREGTLSLTETLRLAEENDFYFGQIYDVAVRSDGRIYVADGEASHVKAIASDGTPQDTIGRPGDGPGEFRLPFRLAFTNTDSLYVMDGRRVSVFTPTGDFRYSFLGQGATGAPRNMMVPGEGGGAFFAYLPLPEQVAETGARATVRHVGSDGEVGDTLFAVRPRQASPEGHPLPFARLSLFDLGPDGTLHHAWSDSLRVTTYSQTGTRRQRVGIPFKPVPVSSEERQTALRDLSKERRTVVRDHMPDTKPAFRHFLIDDEGRYWFGRPTADPDSTAWWVAHPEQKQVATTTLPSTIRLMTVKDGAAYGRATTTSGAPALVRYRIDDGSLH